MSNLNFPHLLDQSADHRVVLEDEDTITLEKRHVDALGETAWIKQDSLERHNAPLLLVWVMDWIINDAREADAIRQQLSGDRKIVWCKEKQRRKSNP